MSVHVEKTVQASPVKADRQAEKSSLNALANPHEIKIRS
jgi:hypothetical protein